MSLIRKIAKRDMINPLIIASSSSGYEIYAPDYCTFYNGEEYMETHNIHYAFEAFKVLDACAIPNCRQCRQHIEAKFRRRQIAIERGYEFYE